MIGNRIVDKIRSISTTPAKELHNNDETEEDVEIATHKKRYVSPEERQQIKNGIRKNIELVGQRSCTQCIE